MNARRVNTAAEVILAALTQNRTTAGIALALDSAQLLMSPETAAELERLRARVVELEQLLADYTEPDVDGAGRTYESYYPQPRPSAPESADPLTALLAPTQVLRDGEHYAATHHDYRVGRDLPEMGGAR